MAEPIAVELTPHPPRDERHAAGVILAAGESRRMGVDKALLPFNDRTFAAGLCELFHEAGADPIYVVLSPPQLASVRPALPPGARVAVNERPEDGQISSLRAGLNALGGIGQGAVVGLVDQPTVSPGTLRALLDAWRETRARACVPRHAGERGHPVLLARSLFPAVFRAKSKVTLREILELHSAEIVEVDVDDPRVLLNVNNPADYRRLIAEYGLPHEKHLGDSWEGFIAKKSASGRG